MMIPPLRLAETPATIEQLHEILHYEPATGVFTWRANCGSRAKMGTAAGNRRTREGYLAIKIGGRNYKAHRLAWLWMTGVWPTLDIDHINGVRDDNRWINLRETTRSQTAMNKRINITSRTGFKGVSKHGNRYEARIKVNGKYIHLGTFDSPIKAATWYHAFAQLVFGEYARTV